MKSLKVYLAQPRGFCAGVERAITIVERAIELDQIPAGAVTVFSAHGVAQKVEDTAHNRKLPVLDATCPLVAKVHREGQRYSTKGYEVILIGHEGHPEVVGTMGRISGDVYLVSNTEDVEKLEVRDPSKLSYIRNFI